MAQEILGSWDQWSDPNLRTAALRVPFDTPLRVDRARKVLDAWTTHERHLVCAALTAFWNKPVPAKRYCRMILLDWQSEVRIECHQREHYFRYSGHLVKALSHPALRSLATDTVRKMLLLETKYPGKLDPELKHYARNIIRGEWPLWSRADDE